MARWLLLLAWLATTTELALGVVKTSNCQKGWINADGACFRLVLNRTNAYDAEVRSLPRPPGPFCSVWSGVGEGVRL